MIYMKCFMFLMVGYYPLLLSIRLTLAVSYGHNRIGLIFCNTSKVFEKPVEPTPIVIRQGKRLNSNIACLCIQ